jgi:hypothetical protein
MNRKDQMQAGRQGGREDQRKPDDPNRQQNPQRRQPGEEREGGFEDDEESQRDR